MALFCVSFLIPKFLIDSYSESVSVKDMDRCPTEYNRYVQDG